MIFKTHYHSARLTQLVISKSFSHERYNSHWWRNVERSSYTYYNSAAYSWSQRDSYSRAFRKFV
jgi:hypothetical protein